MAKKKRKKKVQEPIVPAYVSPTEGQYYWCVNCGHHGDYGFHRKRGIVCEMCGYDDVSIYTIDEINDPLIDNVWLERFRTKEQVEAGVEKQTPAQRQKLPKDHEEMRKVATESKKLLKKLDEKYDKQSILDKIADIRGVK